MDEHCPQALLVQFVAGTLAGAAADDVFGHLSFCGACRTRVMALRALATRPDRAWDVFEATAEHTVPAHAFARRATWAAVRVVVDRAKGMAAIAMNDVEAFVSGTGTYRAFPVIHGAGVGDPVPVGRVSTDDPRVELRLEGPEIGSATVVADARRNAIAVLLYAPPGSDAAQLHADRQPRAALMDPHGRRCHEARFEIVEGAEYLLAEFEQLEAEEWVLGLEFER